MNYPSSVIVNSNITALTMKNTVTEIIDWIDKKEVNKYVCICNTHSIVTAVKDEEFNSALTNANICTPDGMPLVWALRKSGHRNQDRVDGPTLMEKLCFESESRKLKIYLYGSTEKTLQKLEGVLNLRFPQLEIVGSESPPFRDLSNKERLETIKRVNSSNADIVFVGLGCPKQEKFMSDYSQEINSIMIGVGAAFNYLIGDIKRPPVFVRKLGFEWLFRLFQEPKRLFKRYLINNTLFIYNYLFYDKKTK